LKEYAIETHELTKHYGKLVAVDHVSFEVEKGEIFGFLGPNGAGKTTTIKMLTTLIRPTSGSARVLGFDVVSEGSKIRPRIGVVQQEYSFEYALTVEQNLDLYGFLWDVPKRVRKDRIELLLDKFGLQDARKTKPPELSIGQRRRLQVAREFMHDSELMFLDEPTLGLDPQARRVTLDYFREKTAEDVTIFFTTHVMEEAEYVCDRIAIIDHGKILALDTVENIKQKFGGLSVITLKVKQNNLNLHAKLEELTEVEKVLSSAEPDQPIKVYSKRVNSVIPKIMDIITSNDLHLVDLRIKEPSLEDVFIQMVKENTK
jgi:ABC-2 type transport system ATP-binding protein